MRKPNITHVLSNGERVKSIAGKKIPVNNAVYEVILKGVKRWQE